MIDTGAVVTGERSLAALIRTAKLLFAEEELDDARLAPIIRALAERTGDETRQLEHEQRIAQVRERATGPQMAREALGELRGLTATSAILATAPSALCASSELSEAVVSVVENGALVAQAVHLDGDPVLARAALRELASQPLRLTRSTPESDAVRRRRTTVVAVQDGTTANARWAAVMGWSSFAVAPVLQGTELVAVIHAGAGDEGVAADQADMLWGFARGFAQLHEGAALRNALRFERRRTRELISWLDARAAGLDEDGLVLESALEPTRVVAPTPLPGASDAVVFDGVLTRRELEVLRLVSEGRGNREIAAELVIATGTVKFHVRRLLDKLHVSNRAQAVARYYALLDARTPCP